MSTYDRDVKLILVHRPREETLFQSELEQLNHGIIINKITHCFLFFTVVVFLEHSACTHVFLGYFGLITVANRRCQRLVKKTM